jgi:hypothetical protein
LRFLEDLGFKSTNDRLFIPILKALKFVDENGVPTKRYFRFLDDGQWRAVLAEGLTDAYADLYTLHTKAHTLSKQEITGKLKSLTEGKYSEHVISNMARTFIELAKLADFDAASAMAAADVQTAVPAPADAAPPRPEPRQVDELDRPLRTRSSGL